jgi:hypothetical protein
MTANDAAAAAIFIARVKTSIDAMSGLEFVQGLVDGTLPLNSMAETLGYDIVEVAKAGHRNPAGTVHGASRLVLPFRSPGAEQ